jgi:hypothetical protein
MLNFKLLVLKNKLISQGSQQPRLMTFYMVFGRPNDLICNYNPSLGEMVQTNVLGLSLCNDFDCGLLYLLD